MLNFKEIELSDKEWMQPLLDKQKYNSLEYSFTTSYTWRNIYNFKVCEYNGFLVLIADTQKPSFLYPCGEGDIRPVLEAMHKYAADHKFSFIIHSLLLEQRAELEKIFPDKFSYSEDRNDQDYIYSAESLRTLSGKKLSSKRNHINRFIENNPDWSYESITKENIDEVYAMSLDWCAHVDCTQDKSLQAESCAVKQTFAHFFDLNLDGGLLRAKGKVIAFSMGEGLNNDTYLVHIEKAYADIQGSYAMMNKQFVLHNCNGYQFINREDDAGDEGLRKAKLSYRPAMMAEKFTAIYQE